MTLSQSYWQKKGTEALVRYNRTRNGILGDSFEQDMRSEFYRQVDKKLKKFFPNKDIREAYFHLKPRVRNWLDIEFPYDEHLKFVVAGYYAVMLSGVVLRDEDIEAPYRDAVIRFTKKHKVVYF